MAHHEPTLTVRSGMSVIPSAARGLGAQRVQSTLVLPPGPDCQGFTRGLICQSLGVLLRIRRRAAFRWQTPRMRHKD